MNQNIASIRTFIKQTIVKYNNQKAQIFIPKTKIIKHNTFIKLQNSINFLLYQREKIIQSDTSLNQKIKQLAIRKSQNESFVIIQKQMETFLREHMDQDQQEIILYQCSFCEQRFTRNNIDEHIDTNHHQKMQNLISKKSQKSQQLSKFIQDQECETRTIIKAFADSIKNDLFKVIQAKSLQGEMKQRKMLMQEAIKENKDLKAQIKQLQKYIRQLDSQEKVLSKYHSENILQEDNRKKDKQTNIFESTPISTNIYKTPNPKLNKKTSFDPTSQLELNSKVKK